MNVEILEYINTLEEPRKSEIAYLHKFIVKTVSSLKPFIISGVIGYGPYHYKYASGHQGDSAVVGLASRKNYISIYICAADEKGYIAEQYKKELPKANIGKGCIRFKQLSDLDLKVLKEILKKAEKWKNACN